MVVFVVVVTERERERERERVEGFNLTDKQLLCDASLESGGLDCDTQLPYAELS
jgi:hypothetical protein